MTLLVALSVLFAPVVSNAAVSLDVPVAHTQDLNPDCHTVVVDDCHGSHDNAHRSGAKTSHSCCFSLVGIVPDITPLQPVQSSREIIPFSPSLSLSSRIEGLYRPPRQRS